jgi:hypothetical protein
MAEPRWPDRVLVYETLRARPAARERLSRLGFTPRLLEYRLSDAARSLGVTAESLREAVRPVLTR